MSVFIQTASIIKHRAPPKKHSLCSSNKGVEGQDVEDGLEEEKGEGGIKGGIEAGNTREKEGEKVEGEVIRV